MNIFDWIYYVIWLLGRDSLRKHHVFSIYVKNIFNQPDSSAAIDEEGNIDDGEKNGENKKQHLEKNIEIIKIRQYLRVVFCIQLYREW